MFLQSLLDFFLYIIVLIVDSKTFMISDMINMQASMVEEINQRIEKVSNVIQSIKSTARKTELIGIEL